MAVPSKATKSTPPPSKTDGQGLSPSLDYIPTSISKRTRAQSTAPAGQRSPAKTDSSSKDQADEAPCNPGQLLAEEEEESEESSSEDEKPIRYFVFLSSIQSIRFLFIFFVYIYFNQRRRIPHEDGNPTRRKGRTLPMSKRLWDSDSSQSEEREALEEGNGNVRNAVRIRQSRSKSAARYPEDSNIDDNVRRLAEGRYSKDDNYVGYKNVDPLMQKEKGIDKRNSRRSAHEAAKKLKKKIDVFSDDEEVVLS